MTIDRFLSPERLRQTFRDVSDPSYAEGLENGADGEGWDPVSASAETHSRVSEAVRRNHQSYYLLPSSQQTDEPASGPVMASGTVQLSRTAFFDREITVPAGTPLLLEQLDSEGRPAVMPRFTLAAPVTFAVGDPGPINGVAIAERAGDQGNVVAGTITGFELQGSSDIEATVVSTSLVSDTGAADVFWDALIGRYVQFTAGVNLNEVRQVTSFSQAGVISTIELAGAALTLGACEVTPLEWTDLGIVVTQPADFVNGRHGTLDAIGLERRMGRQPGETDIDYAYRLNELPDTIAPNAIDRICAQILTPLGIRYSLHETRTDLTSVILDESPLDVGGLCPDPLVGFSGGALLSESDSVRFFVVCVSVDLDLGSYGLPFDVVNAGINAFDSGSEPGDGFAVTYNQAIARLYASIDSARGFGVGFEIVQDPSL